MIMALLHNSNASASFFLGGSNSNYCNSNDNNVRTRQMRSMGLKFILVMTVSFSVFVNRRLMMFSPALLRPSSILHDTSLLSLAHLDLTASLSSFGDQGVWGKEEYEKNNARAFKFYVLQVPSITSSFLAEHRKVLGLFGYL